MVEIKGSPTRPPSVLPAADASVEVVATRNSSVPVDQFSEQTSEHPSSSDAPLAPAELRALTTIQNLFKQTGASLPPIHSGPGFLLNAQQFSVPIEELVARANTQNPANPSDFLAGEVAVQLGRQCFGYNQVDRDARDNQSLYLVIEMVESLAAARLMIKECPAIEVAVRTYAQKTWDTVISELDGAQAPASLVTVLRAMVDRVTGALTKDAIQNPLHARAAALFVEITDPTWLQDTNKGVDPAKVWLTEEGGGQRAAVLEQTKVRLERTKNQLWPLFVEIVMSDMQRNLLDAHTKVSTSGPVENKSTDTTPFEMPSARELPAHDVGWVVERFFSSKDSAIIDLRNGQAPSPSRILSALRSFAGMTQDGDLLEGAALEISRRLGVHKKLVVATSLHTKKMAEEPWELFPASHPGSLAQVLQAKGAEQHQHRSSADNVSDMARYWVERGQPAPDRYENLKAFFEKQRSDLSFVDDLIRADGLTARIGRQWMDANTRLASGLDVLGESFRNHKEKKDEQRSQRIYQQVEAAESTIKGLRNYFQQQLKDHKKESALSTAAKWLVGGAEEEKTDSFRLESLRLAALHAGQVLGPSVEELQHFFSTYPDETAGLADLVAKKIRWIEKQIAQGDNLRDPLFILDATTWLPSMAAQLRNVELFVKRMDAAARSVPADVQGARALREELQNAAGLTRALVKETADRLAARVTGQTWPPATQRSQLVPVDIGPLPPLARYPRLLTLANEANLFISDIPSQMAIDELHLDPRAKEELIKSQALDRSRSLQSFSDFMFWGRNVSDETDDVTFLREYVLWNPLQAQVLAPALPLLQQLFGQEEAVHQLRSLLSFERQSDSQPDHGDARLARMAAREFENSQDLDALKKWLDPAKSSASGLRSVVASLAKAEDKDAATNLLSPFLVAPNRSLRETARSALEQLAGRDSTELWPLLLAPSQRMDFGYLLNVLDFARADASAPAHHALCMQLVEHPEPAVRLTLIYGVTNARSALDLDPDLCKMIVRLLSDSQEHVRQLAIEFLAQAVDGGSEDAAQGVLRLVLGGQVSDPRIDKLLEKILLNQQFAGTIHLEVRQAQIAFRKDLALLEQHAPRPLVLQSSGESRKRTPTEKLQVARTLGWPPHGLEDIEDCARRFRFVQRLSAKFDSWKAGSKSLGFRDELERLDHSSAIVSNALNAWTGGSEPVGFLRAHSHVVAALTKHGFDPLECYFLENGKFPASLERLFSTQRAVESDLHAIDLASIVDPEQLRAAATIQLWTNNQPQKAIAVLLKHMWSGSANVDLRRVAEDIVGEFLGTRPWMEDGSRAERVTARQTEDSITPYAGQILDEALLLVLEGQSQQSPMTQGVCDMMSRGEPQKARARMCAAFETASVGVLPTILNAAPRLVSKSESRRIFGSRAPTLTTDTPWLFQILEQHPAIDAARLDVMRQAIRQGRGSAVDSYERAKNDARFALTFNLVLTAHPEATSEELSRIGAILADSDTDECRQKKMEGIKRLLGNPHFSSASDIWDVIRQGCRGIGQAKYIDLSTSFSGFFDFLYRLFTVKKDISRRSLELHSAMFAGCSSYGTRLNFSDRMIRLYQLMDVRNQSVTEALLESIARWLELIDQTSSGWEKDKSRDAALGALGDLVPIDLKLLDAIAETHARAGAEAGTQFLLMCKNRRQIKELTTDDVIALGAQARVSERPSAFRNMFAGLVSDFNWTPSEKNPYVDPFAADYLRDNRAMQSQKSALNHAFGQALNTIRIRTGEKTTPVLEKYEFSDFGVTNWFKSQTANVPDARKQQIAGDYVIPDLTSEQAAAEQRLQTFRQAQLSKERPYVRASLELGHDIRDLARVIDVQASQGRPQIRFREADSGGLLNVPRFVQALVKNEVQSQRARDEGVKGPGTELGKVFLKQVRVRRESAKKLTLDLIIAIDVSGSTGNEGRLEQFKRMAVQALETNEKIQGMEIRTGLIVFSDNTRILLPLAKTHTVAEKAGAIESLVADGGTNDVIAVYTAQKMLSRSEADAKVIWFLTDGAGQNNMAAAVQDVAQKCRAKVIGTGVSADAQHVSTTYPFYFYGDNPKELSQGMFRFYKDEVLNG